MKNLKDLQKKFIIVISVVCFVVFCFVSFFNTYRLLMLEKEVSDLRKSVEECRLNIPDGIPVNIEKLRKRRNTDKDYNYPEMNKKYFANISEHKRSSSSATSQMVVKDWKENDIRNNHHNYKKHTRRSLDSGSYTPNDYTSGSSEAEFPTVHNEEVLPRRTRLRMQTLDERYLRTGRIKPLPSIHLNGDTSKYVLGTHDNFNGNGHLKHPNDYFVDWKPSSWAESLGMMSHFEFYEGNLTIKQSGLYLIYAQIYYLDTHDVNGYRVFRNGQMILQCTVSLHSGIRAQRGNTCFTAGVEYLADGDKIFLGDIVPNHYSLFEAGKSFFGIVKLGDVRTRS